MRKCSAQTEFSPTSCFCGMRAGASALEDARQLVSETAMCMFLKCLTDFLPEVLPVRTSKSSQHKI
jgi:hypothetical protein